MVTRPGANPVPVVCSGTIVCTAQHRRTCLTACGRHHRSSLVAVSALLTPRHCRCRRLVGHSCRPRLSGGCRAGVEQSATRDSGLVLTCDISEADQVSPFSSYGWLGAVYSDRQQTSVLSCATVLSYKLVKCPATQGFFSVQFYTKTAVLNGFVQF